MGRTEFRDLTGQRFGRLLVVERGEPYRVPTTGEARATWNCVCDCGNRTRATTGGLNGSRSTNGIRSCGCLQRDIVAEMNRAHLRPGMLNSRTIDLTGQRFGRLLVLCNAGVIRASTSGKTTGSAWECLCDCGRTKVVRGSDLRTGSSTGCGRSECRPGTKSLGMGMARAIYAAYRCRARGRSDRPTPARVFEITFEQFLNLTAQPCTYCGSAPETSAWNGKANGAFLYNGLDRVDNEIGYTVDNVVTCCGVCNLMKRDLSVSDFIERCRRIADHHRTN